MHELTTMTLTINSLGVIHMTIGHVILVFVLMFIYGYATISSAYGDEDVNIKEEDSNDGEKE